MNKRIMVFVLFLSLCIAGYSTDVIGPQSGVWTLANSPYNVTGEINVPLNQTLTVEPGVQVIFGGHYKFIINGQLLADGTTAAPIVFTATNTVDGWHGLRFIDTETNNQPASSISHALLQYGRATGVSPDYRGGALYCDASTDLTLESVVITDCSAVGNGGAIYLDDSDITLIDVTISNNTAAGGAGISMTNSNPEISGSVITNNTATYDGGGIYCNLSNPNFTDVELSKNTTTWNGGGITLFNSSSVDLINLTIVDNFSPQDGSDIAVMYNSSATLLNSIIWNFVGNGIYIESNSSMAATYSDIKNGTGEDYFGTGCVDLDPLFADYPNGDYHLTWANAPTPDETKSPCIDSGDPDGSLDPDGTRADMGAYYYVQSGITGVVTISGGTGNVEDVEITADDGTTVTTTNPDSDGNYHLLVGNGTYDITASLDGYNSQNYNNIVVNDQVVILNITLTPPLPGIINGIVDLEGNGDILQVVISAGDITTNPYAVEDPTQPGVIDHYEYDLELSPGLYDVTATLDGYNPETLNNISVNSNQTNSGNDFYLTIIQEEGTITGTVTLVGGTGDVTQVTITAGGETTNPIADGTYSLTLLNGNYPVTASLDGYSTVTLNDIPVIAFQTVGDIDFSLIDGWDPVTGTQYITTLYATTDYDGDFITGEGMNQLAIFDASDNCRGNAIWIEGNHPLWNNFWPLEGYWYLSVVSNDNSGTEALNFKFYNEDDGTINNCNETLYFPEDPNNDAAVNLTIPSPDHTQTFDFMQEWNWFSFNLHPAISLVATLFDPISSVATGNIQLKHGATSITYWLGSSAWVGGLQNVQDGDGYKMQLPAAYDGFTLTGTRINPVTHPITMGYHYNWLGFYPYTSVSLEDAFVGLQNPVTGAQIAVTDTMIVKTQTKSAAYYGGWIGDLTVMEPGKMYMVYFPATMVANDTTYVSLAYPPISETTRGAVEVTTPNPANWELMQGTKSNMIALASIQTSSEDYAVGVFDSQGNCRSIGKAYNGFHYFTIVGNTPDEELFFHLYDVTTAQTFISKTSITFQENDFLGSTRNPMEIRFEGSAPGVPTTLNLEQNYPNPFNPTTNISYSIPQDGHVTLQIFNTRGQLVETLIDQHQKAASYNVSWDAEGQSSGIYFYKMSFGDRAEIKKCILLK